MPLSNKRSVSFYIGDHIPEIEAEKKNFVKFLEWFYEPEDKYYAITLFEEKPILLISKCDWRELEYLTYKVYNSGKPVYNLSVKANQDFFIETAEDLDVLKEICKTFGFRYELDDSGSKLQW